MKNRLMQLENRLETLVERLFGGRMDIRAVLRAVAREFDRGLTLTGSGRLIAPNQVILTLHPDDYEALLAQETDLSTQLIAYLVELSRQRDALLSHEPEVIITNNEHLERHTITVQLNYTRDSRFSTQQMPVTDIDPEAFPRDAQLIIEGRVTRPLDRHVINIGRHFDNHIVLEDVRVSRWHSQIRLRHGRFVIFDLNSSQGTYVNGTQVVEHILSSGDVITLGGAKIIYMEEETTEQQENLAGDTQIRRPPNWQADTEI